jgi:hypothetical protein
MKRKPSKRKRRVTPEKRYDFNVKCSFTLQFGFVESEIAQDPEGGIGDFRPTDKTLRSLKKELTEALGNYGVGDFELYADSDDLLGIVED